jgi:hypothetical protein
MGVLVQIVPECARDAVAYPCGCEFVDVMQMVQNIMIDMIYLGTFVLVLLLVYVGFLYVTNAGNPANIAKAKSIAMSAIIGFVVMMGGFLIVSTVMDTFAKENLSGGWTSFFGITRSACELTENAPRGAGSVGVTGGGAGSSTLSCATCVSVEGASFAHKGPGQGCDLSKSREAIQYCEIDGGVYDKLESLQSSFGGGWRVNELWPPTVTHANDCHQNGTCVDASLTSGTTPATLASFIVAAESVGLYPVWEDRELQTFNQCNTLRLELVRAGATNATLQYGLNVPPHFSLYNRSPSRTGTCIGA